VPLGARFSTPFPTGLAVPQPTLKQEMGLFPGVRRPGSGFDHPLSSSLTRKSRAISLLPSGTSLTVRG
jgi:hypothetical protein